jgi:hypothetical protein
MIRTMVDVPIKEFTHLYSVTRLGNVFSKRTGKALKPSRSGDGYLKVILCDKSVKKTISIHRLVAMAYLPNLSSLRVVDHVNGKKQDNRVDNLQWVDHSENLVRSYKQGRQINYNYPGQTPGRKGGTMIFYITKENETKLRQVKESGESMSGLVNKLLEKHFNGPLNTLVSRVLEVQDSEPTFIPDSQEKW